MKATRRTTHRSRLAGLRNAIRALPLLPGLLKQTGTAGGLGRRGCSTADTKGLSWSVFKFALAPKTKTKSENGEVRPTARAVLHIGYPLWINAYNPLLLGPGPAQSRRWLAQTRGNQRLRDTLPAKDDAHAPFPRNIHIIIAILLFYFKVLHCEEWTPFRVLR